MVCVKDFDAVDNRLSFDEVRNLGGWGKVVALGPIVNTNGKCGGGEVEEGRDEEEEEVVVEKLHLGDHS